MPKIFSIEEILTKLQKKIKGVSFFPWTLYINFATNFVDRGPQYVTAKAAKICVCKINHAIHRANKYTYRPIHVKPKNGPVLLKVKQNVHTNGTLLYLMMGNQSNANFRNGVQGGKPFHDVFLLYKTSEL